jgi:hypothetical protein
VPIMGAQLSFFEWVSLGGWTYGPLRNAVGDTRPGR